MRNGVPSGNTPDEPAQAELADAQKIPLDLDLGEAPAVRDERLAPRLDVALEVAILLLKVLRLEEQPLGPDDFVVGRHALFFHPGGFAPRSPPTGSLAGTPTPRAARQAHSLPLVRGALRLARLREPQRPAPLARLTRSRSFAEPSDWLACGDPNAPRRSPGSLAPARSRKPSDWLACGDPNAPRRSPGSLAPARSRKPPTGSLAGPQRPAPPWAP